MQLSALPTPTRFAYASQQRMRYYRRNESEDGSRSLPVHNENSKSDISDSTNEASFLYKSKTKKRWKVFMTLQSMFVLLLLLFLRILLSLKFSQICPEDSPLFYHSLLSICITLLVLTIFSAISVWALCREGEQTDFRIRVELREEANHLSMNYIAAFVIPLAIGDIDSWPPLLILIAITTLVGVVTYVTESFYSNPLLQVFGYSCYLFEITSDYSGQGGKEEPISDSMLHIGFIRGDLSKASLKVKIRKVSRNCFFLRQ